MDRLQLAQERFQRLVPGLGRVDTVLSREVENWLRDDVAAVVENLIGIPCFQRLARWSPDHLSSGSSTPERRLVEAVDAALVRAAAAMVAAAREAEAAQRLTALAARQWGKSGPANLAVVTWVAGRPWFDLVCPEEYFHPFRDLHLRNSHPERTADFRARHELRVPLGDYVLRGLLARAEFLARHICDFWDYCFPLLQVPTRAGGSRAEACFAARLELDQSFASLRSACQGGSEARLREACVALTQVYTAYHPTPDLNWLGCPPGSAAAEASRIRSCIFAPAERFHEGDEVGSRIVPERYRRPTPCRPNVVHHVAIALHDIGILYRQPMEAEDLVDAVRQSKRLVLVDRAPRAVYWQGEVVDGDWDGKVKEWELLWMLVKRACQGRTVDRLDLSNPDSTRAIVDRRSRLSRMLPVVLDDAIEAVPTRAYRLTLAATDIVLLQLDDNQRLVEAGVEMTSNLFKVIQDA
jgi:hypothetical protein